MTKKDFQKKIKELIKENNKALEKETLRLYECGGVDISAYDSTYELPKIIMTAACQKMADQWLPFTEQGKKAVKNLSHF